MATANEDTLGWPPIQNENNPNRRTVQKWMDPKNEYGQIEILQLKASDGGKLPKNPFIISKTIENAVGKIASAHTEGKGERYVLKVRNHAHFEKLQKVSKLIDGTAIQIVPHPTQNIVKCVVTCREVETLNEEELLQELEPQGVRAVHRIKKFVNGSQIGTPTLIITFNGTVAPAHVYFGLIRIKTRTYYQSPLLCYKCFDYGHPKTKCANLARCSNCSQSHEAEAEKCSNAAYCKNCEQAHSPKDKKCPVYLKEDAIIHLKTDKNCTYIEAKEIYEHENSTVSYASKVQERLQQARNESAKDDEIKNLKKEIENLKMIAKEIITIKTENVKLREQYKKKLEENYNLIQQQKEIMLVQSHQKPQSNNETTTKTVTKRPLVKTSSIPIHTPGKKMATADNEGDANNPLEGNLDDNQVPTDEELADREMYS